MTILKRFPWLIPLFPLLLILSYICALVVFIRYQLYKIGFLKSERFSVPIISIGSIELGGSGKTPMTIYLAEKLIAKGFKVAVLTRGYKRKCKGRLKTDPYTQVEPDRNWQEFGDEAMLIKSRVYTAKVLVCKDRIKAIKEALKNEEEEELISL